MQLEKNLRCLDSLSCGCRVTDWACCGILTLVPWLQWFASAVLYKTLSSLDLCSQRAVCRIQMIVSLQGTRAHVCVCILSGGGDAMSEPHGSVSRSISPQQKHTVCGWPHQTAERMCVFDSTKQLPLTFMPGPESPSGGFL